MPIGDIDSVLISHSPVSGFVTYSVSPMVMNWLSTLKNAKLSDSVPRTRSGAWKSPAMLNGISRLMPPVPVCRSISMSKWKESTASSAEEDLSRISCAGGRAAVGVGVAVGSGVGLGVGVAVGSGVGVAVGVGVEVDVGVGRLSSSSWTLA